MLKVYNAQIKDILIIKNILNTSFDNANFFSEFNESILKYILRKNCFLVYDNLKLQCILFFKNNEEVFVIPAYDSFSFFKFLYVLKKFFNIKEYRLNIKYKKLNINFYKKYFNLKIKEDYLCLFLDIINKRDEKITDDDLHVRKMKIGLEEEIRVKLQNDIFSNIKGRKELTINEVIYEERSSKFLKDMCFILEYKGIPAGYGQIIRNQNDLYLVNFGIIKEYQGRGFGYFFLDKIISFCKDEGIDKLYLTVDKNNKKAVNLYLKYGFKLLNGNASLILYK